MSMTSVTVPYIKLALRTLLPPFLLNYCENQRSGWRSSAAETIRLTIVDYVAHRLTVLPARVAS